MFGIEMPKHLNIIDAGVIYPGISVHDCRSAPANYLILPTFAVVLEVVKRIAELFVTDVLL